MHAVLSADPPLMHGWTQVFAAWKTSGRWPSWIWHLCGSMGEYQVMAGAGSSGRHITDFYAAWIQRPELHYWRLFSVSWCHRQSKNSKKKERKRKRSWNVTHRMNDGLFERAKGWISPTSLLCGPHKEPSERIERKYVGGVNVEQQTQVKFCLWFFWWNISTNL